MSQIEQILELEKLNNKQIRLYRKDKYWLAFERSAFNLFSVQCVDFIFKIEKVEEHESLLVAVVKNGTHDYLLGNPLFSVLRKSENEILLDCRFTCGGFLHWKDNLIPLFSQRNLGQVLRDVLPVN